MSTELIAADLADLAARIRTEMKRGLEHVLAAGELLLEAKARVPHGQWQPWLRDHCGVSERSARRYVQLAGNRAEIEAKTATVADLTINGALQLLSPPIIPELQPHPFNEIFPMCDKTVDALAESIRDHGQARPIVLHEGRILDGKLRYLACKKAGVAPITTTYEGDDPLGYVVSMNLHRQNHTESERAAAMANLEEYAKRYSAVASNSVAISGS